MKNVIVAMAMQYLNVPYVWGANGPFSYDCSALVLKVLKDARVFEKDELDMTAQGIYYTLLGKHGLYHTPKSITEGNILFFGKGVEHITHIAIAYNNEWMIHAGGGGRTTNTIEEAEKRDARVKISWIDSRSDLVAVIKLNLEDRKPIWCDHE